MFTLDQINEIHDRYGASETLADYLSNLRAIGVERSVSFICDGHTDHHGADGYVVATPPTHDTFVVADVSDHDGFLAALQDADYVKMSERLAASGVDRWVFDTRASTITYLDKAGNELLEEHLS
jgi:uncharacterized protein YbcV (DUF1398 family)